MNEKITRRDLLTKAAKTVVAVGSGFLGGSVVEAVHNRKEEDQRNKTLDPYYDAKFAEGEKYKAEKIALMQSIENAINALDTGNPGEALKILKVAQEKK